MSLHILHYSDIENAFDDPTRIGRLASRLQTLRDETTLVCDTGDTTAPGLLSQATDGEHALEFFESVSPDFATIGNHDFDNGLDALRDIVERTPQQWLVANLHEDGAPFAADYGIQRTATTDVDGTTVGLVGVTAVKTVENHNCTDNLTVTDPVEAVADAVESFGPAVERVVVLSHAGTYDDGLARIERVDAVLGGHLHDRRADDVEGTPVVRPGERGDVLAEVTLTDDSAEATLHEVTDARVATDVADSYRDLYAELGLAKQVTHIGTPVSRDRDDLYPESAVGNFAADAFRWGSNADVAIFHPLMLRTGPTLAGEVTVGDVRSLMPFDNEMYTTTLSGDELWALFESMAAPDHIDVGLEVFGHVSGVTLTWRRTDDDLELVEATVDGEAIDPDASYTVVAPAFEIVRDELYPPLTSDHREGSVGHQHDLLVEYARTHGLDSEPDDRMTVLADTASGAFRSLR